MDVKSDVFAHATFGDTNRADSVPDCLAPSPGPVYLEGRLVLSLSFQGDESDARLIGDGDDPIEYYRLWDDLSEAWYSDFPLVVRFEQADAVVRSWPNRRVLWEGAVNTRAHVIPMPDLDEAGIAENQSCDLRWRLA